VSPVQVPRAGTDAMPIESIQYQVHSLVVVSNPYTPWPR